MCIPAAPRRAPHSPFFRPFFPNLEPCWKNLLAVLGRWSIPWPNDFRDIPCFIRPAAHSTRSPFLPRNKSGSRLRMEKLLHQLLCLRGSQGKAQVSPRTSPPRHSDLSYEAWGPHTSSEAPRSPSAPTRGRARSPRRAEGARGTRRDTGTEHPRASSCPPQPAFSHVHLRREKIHLPEHDFKCEKPPRSTVAGDFSRTGARSREKGHL